MLNPALDPRAHRVRFQHEGRLQVRGLLQERAAQALRHCLQHDVPWTLAYRREGVSQTLPRQAWSALDATARARMLTELQAAARGQFGFAYESYMMVKAYADRLDPGLLLHQVLEYLNSPEFLDFARSLTGLAGIRRVSAQATRYCAGHFLRRHSDFDAAEGRLAAYVINLTPRWEADWGGLLQFLDDSDDRVVDTFFPFWNSLSLFRVPQAHVVSAVMPWAEGERMAITGWFESGRAA